MCHGGHVYERDEAKVHEIRCNIAFRGPEALEAPKK